MPQINFSELSEDLRVQLTESGREELWHRVDEFGGVKAVSDAFDFSPSKMYNWRNKELALPVGFVQRLMGQNSSSEVIQLKGESSSGGISDPEFPLSVSEELLTRVQESVKTNSEGTPFYITDERSLADRFMQLLEELGADYSLYSRNSRFELRYPKLLHDLFLGLDFEEDTLALVDESGQVRNGKILISDREIDLKSFDGRIFSREKRFEIALETDEKGEIAEIVRGERKKVRKLSEDLEEV
jgi:hypothetical protein